jgi:hypothetical protein
MMRFLTLLAGAALLASPAYAQSKEDACKQRAAKVIMQEYRDDPHSQPRMAVGDSAHYNRRLQKCFLLVSAVVVPKRDEPNTGFLLWELRDLDEGVAYGVFLSRWSARDKTVFLCHVHGTPCYSENEWTRLANEFTGE